MRSRVLVIVVALLVATPSQAGFFSDLFGGSKKGGEGVSAALTNDKIISGLKEALKVGTERVVERLGVTDGFLGDDAVRIPLPKSFKPVKKAFKKIGLSSVTDDLETRLNRAAEAAVPVAQSLFVQAIQDMTVDDVMGIYKGSPDAATQYFRTKMTAGLTEAMRPIVNDNLEQVGALKVYDSAISRYKDIPFVPDVKNDLTDHVLEKSLDGVFLYLAREEAAIRSDPGARTTELLKTVFGTD